MKNNKSFLNGGGFFVTNSYYIGIEDATIENNYSENGAGIYINYSKKVNINKAKFNNHYNTQKWDMRLGAALYLQEIKE